MVKYRYLAGNKRVRVYNRFGRPNGTVVKKTHFATVSPTVRDLEWAAGFLEGEGSFSTNGAVAAVQVNPDPIVRLQALFGGRAVKKKPINDKWSDYWFWSISGSRARGVALTLYTLMSNKRKQQIRKLLKGAK